ncbi:unnamed protein product [Periconia digitata]|uniref:CFEM domain-containing protein n=1 Tax=Periconia digitata TaxID=1303443 RepID=A0A9W4U3U3_9PLEO|nr:unnamed protein product [Periconia digitata]
MTGNRVLLLVLVLLTGQLANALSSSPAGSALKTSPIELLGKIPPCAITCLTTHAPSIGCALLDFECQCSSTNSTKILQPCLEAQCTYEQTFQLLHVQADLCDKPRDSKSLHVEITAYCSGIVAVCAVVLRFISRYIGGSKLWWDDWLQLASVILVIPMTVALLLNVRSGVGRHIWDLKYEDVMNVGKYTYIATVFWAVELLLLKFSILCLYLRLFPNPWLKRGVIWFSVFTALFTIPLIGMAAFQCVPVHAIWDLEAKKSAKCIDYIGILKATVVYEVVAETILFALPVPIVLKLKLKRTKKIQLMTFFGLGIIVIGISCARLPGLPGVVDSEDQPYTTVHATILGFTASGVGHICAAVPTIRALLRLVCCSANPDGSRPSNFGGSSGASKGKLGSSQQSSRYSRTNDTYPPPHKRKFSEPVITHQTYDSARDLTSSSGADYLPEEWDRGSFSGKSRGDDRDDKSHFGPDPYELQDLTPLPPRAHLGSADGSRRNRIPTPGRSKWVLLDNSRDTALQNNTDTTRQ